MIINFGKENKQTFDCPFRAALCSGVTPEISYQTFDCPFRTALCSGVIKKRIAISMFFEKEGEGKKRRYLNKVCN